MNCINKLPQNYSKTRLYRTYHHMKGRCYKETSKDYKHYGGRGIRICKYWLGEDGFLNFYEWAMSNGYSDNLTIDRIDVNGNYEPSNCRWVDWYGQANNRTNSNYVTHNGITKTITEWSRQYGIRQETLWRRIYKYGMSLEQAISYDPKRKGITKEICLDLRKKGFSLKEMSKILNCSISTIEKRMR